MATKTTKTEKEKALDTLVSQELVEKFTDFAVKTFEVEVAIKRMDFSFAGLGEIIGTAINTESPLSYAEKGEQICTTLTEVADGLLVDSKISKSTHKRIVEVLGNLAYMFEKKLTIRYSDLGVGLFEKVMVNVMSKDFPLTKSKLKKLNDLNHDKDDYTKAVSETLQLLEAQRTLGKVDVAKVPAEVITYYSSLSKDEFSDIAKVVKMMSLAKANANSEFAQEWNKKVEATKTKPKATQVA